VGTILNGQAEVFQTIAAGVAKHKGVQLVLSIGDQLEPEQIGSVPNNAIIVKRAPQLELLKLASVYHAFWGEHRARVSCAGCPSSGHPRNL
jgi:zeaxanthin glucosyltransferase